MLETISTVLYKGRNEHTMHIQNIDTSPPAIFQRFFFHFPHLVEDPVLIRLDILQLIGRQSNILTTDDARGIRRWDRRVEEDSALMRYYIRRRIELCFDMLRRDEVSSVR
jgi:hypothetical protein